MYDVKRCRMSKEGREELSRSVRKDSEGVIVGESKNGKCFKVLWEDNKTPHSYHKDFIEIITSESNIYVSY